MGDVLVCAHFLDLAHGFDTIQFSMTAHGDAKVVKLGVSSMSILGMRRFVLWYVN